MNLLGNIIWLVFGGFMAAIGYVVGGFVLCITVVGIPWGLQCFKCRCYVILSGCYAADCTRQLFI
jgi:uncharacterized membrane protein YccF (DUF307 family)